MYFIKTMVNYCKGHRITRAFVSEEHIIHTVQLLWSTIPCYSTFQLLSLKHNNNNTNTTKHNSGEKTFDDTLVRPHMNNSYELRVVTTKRRLFQ